MGRAAFAPILVVALAHIACAAPEASVPSPTASPPAATSTPTARPSPDLLASLLAPQLSSWKPAGPTLLVTVVRQPEGSLVAVPLDGSPTTVLATIRDLSGSVPATVLAVPRSDGVLVAFALATGPATRDIALLDLSTGRARWLTTSGDAGGVAWAADGNSLYYGVTDPARDVARVALDGSPLASVHLDAVFGSLHSVSRVTSEGVLVGADEFNGPTAWALDLATGRKASFGEHNSSVVAWRRSAPHGLVAVRTSLVAPGAGYLALWDDATGKKTVILAEPIAGADFDPTGARVVAAVSDRADQQIRLHIMNADGSGSTTLAGTENARSPIWAEGGIAYHTYTSAGSNAVRIVPPAGGASRTLFTTTDTIQRIQLVVAAR